MKNEEIAKIENLRNSKDTFVIRWNITKLCNYYCDFCVQGNKEKHLKDSSGETEEIRMKICKRLVHFIETKLNDQYTSLHIYLIGGEITILKDFPQILSNLLKVNFNGEIDFHITTNLSADIKTLAHIKKIVNEQKSPYQRRLYISASYYKEFTTEEEFIQKVKTFYKSGNTLQYYINNIKNRFKEKNTIMSKIIYKMIIHMQKKKSNIFISISYPLITDEDYKAYQIFKKKYQHIVNAIHYIIIRNYKHSISDSLKNKLVKNNIRRIKVTTTDNKVHYFSNTSKIGLAILKTKHFNPYGMLCDSGIHNLSISSLGRVSRCPSCMEKSVIGNILEDEIDLCKEKMVCPNGSCSCDYYQTIERGDVYEK